MSSLEIIVPRVFPYVVIRYMSAMYGQMSINFFSGGSTEEYIFDSKDKVLHINLTIPKDMDELPKPVLETLIRTIQTVQKKFRFRMCLVVKPDLCYFVEPTGVVEESNTPPHPIRKLNVN